MPYFSLGGSDGSGTNRPSISFPHKLSTHLFSIAVGRSVLLLLLIIFHSLCEFLSVYRLVQYSTESTIFLSSNNDLTLTKLKLLAPVNARYL